LINVRSYSVEALRECDREEVIRFLEHHQLELEKSVEYTAVLWHHQKIVGTCSYDGCVLKSFAVQHCYQGLGVASMLLTHMINTLFDQGIFTVMAYSLSKNRTIFEGLQFSCIYDTGNVALFEIGINSISRYLKSLNKELGDSRGQRSAIVMNGNPFTKGHQYLIEQASKENDEVVVFVVEEERSLFPFDVRFRLIQEGANKFKNVKVVAGGKYIVSAATFPEYFEPEMTKRSQHGAELDAGMFCSIIAPILEIDTRYVGTEPYCEVTKVYNQVLEKTFKKHDLSFVEVNRHKVADYAVSASSVRACLKSQEWDRIRQLVPESTYQFLVSEQARSFIEIIINDGVSRH